MSVRDEFIRRLRAVPSNTAALRSERKGISRDVAAFEPRQLLTLAHALIDAGVARFVAYELVQNHRPTMESVTRAQVEKLSHGMGHWGQVDAFACFIAGPAWRSG